MKRILFAGESWISSTTHVKGLDSFTQSKYETGERWLKEALETAGYEVDFMPNHLAIEQFPFTMEQIKQYDVVILSDIGSNTLLLPEAVTIKGEMRPNRCDLIQKYVLEGGALLMIGGYMTFTGIDGKGRWGTTSVQKVLPVKMLETDDRMEHPEGVVAKAVPGHPLLKGIEEGWPELLGYNKTVAMEDADVVATINGDPLLAVAKRERGRCAVFTSDCAPHWAPVEFLEWEGYQKIWSNLMDWLTEV